jgi:hypothetical protein
MTIQALHSHRDSAMEKIPTANYPVLIIFNSYLQIMAYFYEGV